MGCKQGATWRVVSGENRFAQILCKEKQEWTIHTFAFWQSLWILWNRIMEQQLRQVPNVCQSDQRACLKTGWVCPVASLSWDGTIGSKVQICLSAKLDYYIMSPPYKLPTSSPWEGTALRPLFEKLRRYAQYESPKTKDLNIHLMCLGPKIAKRWSKSTQPCAYFLSQLNAISVW